MDTAVQYGQPTKVLFSNTLDTLIIPLSRAIAHGPTVQENGGSA